MYQEENKLVLLPLGWLGNRIRAISAAYTFAKRYNKKLKIVWIEYDQGMRLPFSKVFATPPGSEVIEIKGKAKWFVYAVFSKLARMTKLNRLGNYLIRIGSWKQLDEECSTSQKNLLIATDSYFFPCENIPLRFNDKIQQTGDSFLGDIRTDYVGMHIRRGNNHRAVQNSPTELFIKAAEEEIEQNKRCVFLCTDDLQIKKVFKDKFGDKVYTRDVELDHTKEEQFIDAAIDLYCLSKAKKIYGSYYSSFSTISALLNHVPLTRLQLQ